MKISLIKFDISCNMDFLIAKNQSRPSDCFLFTLFSLFFYWNIAHFSFIRWSFARKGLCFLSHHIPTNLFWNKVKKVRWNLGKKSVHSIHHNHEQCFFDLLEVSREKAELISWLFSGYNVLVCEAKKAYVNNNNGKSMEVVWVYSNNQRSKPVDQ